MIQFRIVTSRVYSSSLEGPIAISFSPLLISLHFPHLGNQPPPAHFIAALIAPCLAHPSLWVWGTKTAGDPSHSYLWEWERRGFTRLQSQMGGALPPLIRPRQRQRKSVCDVRHPHRSAPEQQTAARKSEGELSVSVNRARKPIRIPAAVAQLLHASEALG